MLNKLNKIKPENPVDNVIRQLRLLINTGELKPGDILPSERKLSEQMGVGRLVVRDAIKKLEFYGLVKTYPQSGTKIKGKGLMALEGLILDILDFEEADFMSIVEIRNLLEIKSAGLAALKRTDEDIERIQHALLEYENKVNQNLSAAKEDFQLHLSIAEVSGNSVLKLLMNIITPDILNGFNTSYPVQEDRTKDILIEHKNIVDQIIAQNPKEAKNAMRQHLRGANSMFFKKLNEE